jgi:hypothetical protein
MSAGTVSQAKAASMPPISVNRRVRFYEVRAEDGQRVAQIDYEKHFFDVVAGLPEEMAEHWSSGTGLRARGRTYLPPESTGPKPRVPLVIVDRVHRMPEFKYVRGGIYSDHAFDDPDKEFAEPKFLAFFERNVVATFTSGLRMPVVEACLNTWRARAHLPPVAFVHVVDFERLERLRRIDEVGRLTITLPSEVAGAIYRERDTPIAQLFRSRSPRQSVVTLSLDVDLSDEVGSQELKDELAFLLEDDEVYERIASNSASVVEATYYEEDSSRPTSHNFLGQALAVSVRVDVPEPEKGPEPHHASEALAAAYQRRAEAIASVVGQV